ncbi:hypothetical protein MPSEU_000977600 [Mayamaea pseudoterrestris]|nr:hypothetical protein MPSEU_000977600 [Mayamaea pseudoterrestris]
MALPNEAMKMPSQKHHLLRLYLVRHGESQANLDGTLAGQSDSPLTDTGIAEAKALSRSHWMTDTDYWRVYSSDLSRAHDTARLSLQLGRAASIDGDDDVGRTTIHLDKRLRERAYGAREGMSRKLSLDEATAYRVIHGIDDPVGPYETEQDITDRCVDWLQQLVHEANNAAKQRQLQTPLHVAVFSHAGFIRATLLRYVERATLDRHPNARQTDGYRTPKLLIPNTSVNVLDVYLHDNCTDLDCSFETRLVELNCTNHLVNADGLQSRRAD